LLEIFSNAGIDLVEAVFNSSICENEEFQIVLNNPEIIEFNFPKISLCDKCKIKVETFKNLNKDNHIESNVVHLLNKIMEN
jgi:hypothetical protein